MGMDQLLAALEREAVAEVEEKLERAKAEAAELLTDCQAELAQRLDDQLRDRERELSVQIALEVARAQRAGRSEVLLARDGLLSRVREAVVGRLADLAQDSGYRARLPEDLREAVSFLAEGPAEVVCSFQLATPLAAALDALGRGDLTLREDPGLEPGFVVRARDGHAEVDARLATRLERMWPELSLAVLASMEERGWWVRAELDGDGPGGGGSGGAASGNEGAGGADGRLE